MTDMEEKWSLAAGDENVEVTGLGEADPLGLCISPKQPGALPQGPRGLTLFRREAV